MKKIALLLLLVVSAAAIQGCYRMPTDEDFCTVPCTNNPHLTGSSNHSCIPGIGQ